MAVALRGAAAVPTGNPTTSFTVGIDAAVVAGDICILAVTSRDSTGAGTLSVADNDAGGNTWTKIGNSTDHKATLWWKRATSATAGKTVTVSNAVGSASGVLKCFSGASPAGTPIINVVVETNASADETHAGFTPTSANAMIGVSVHNYANDNAVTSLTGATLGALTATEKLSTGGSDCACSFGHRVNTGTTATGNFTWAQTDGTTYSIAFEIMPELFGAVSKTLGAMTAAASGTVAVGGAVAKTLGALALAASVTVAVAGSLSKTLDALTVEAEGTVASSGVSGSVNQTLGSATASSSGTVAVSGSASRTLGALTVVGAGTVDVRGSTAATLGELQPSAAGTVAVTGASAQTLGALTSDGDATVQITGTLTKTLGAASSSAAGAVAVSGSSSQALGAVTLDGEGVVGDVPITGSLSRTLDPLGGDASGQVAVTAMLAKTLSGLSAVSIGRVAITGSLTRTLGALTVDSSGGEAPEPPAGPPPARISGLTMTFPTATNVRVYE